MTNQSAGSKIYSSINQFDQITADPLNIQSDKHQGLNHNSVLTRINTVNAKENSMRSINNISSHHRSETLRGSFVQFNLKNIETLELRSEQIRKPLGTSGHRLWSGSNTRNVDPTVLHTKNLPNVDTQESLGKFTALHNKPRFNNDSLSKTTLSTHKQPIKYQKLNNNSLLIHINETNTENIKHYIKSILNHRNETLKGHSTRSILKDIEALQLEPGRMLIMKKEYDESISLSFAKKRKIRIRKVLEKLAHCLRSDFNTQSDRTRFGGAFGNKFITEKPILILSESPQEAEVLPQLLHFDDELSTTAISGRKHRDHKHQDKNTQSKPPNFPEYVSFVQFEEPTHTSVHLSGKHTKSSSIPKEVLAHNKEYDDQLSILYEKSYQKSKPDAKIQVAVAGHGDLDVNYSTFEVPPNVTVRTWRIPGQVLSDKVGREIEDLKSDQSVLLKYKHEDYLYEAKFKSGDQIPDYMVYPPKGLNISHKSITVKKPTPLSTIIREQAKKHNGNPIQIEFSACQSYKIPRFGRNEQQNIENLRIRLGIMQRDIFALSKETVTKSQNKVIKYFKENIDAIEKDLKKHKEQYNQKGSFHLFSSTGSVIGDEDYIDDIISDISQTLEELQARLS